jgi:general secretion pathway protein A
MYEAYFNLKTKPFELLPNPDFLFPSKSHKRAVTYLDYGIRERAGFILLTGEVGSGKTTIIRDLIKKFGDTVVLAKVFNTSVDCNQLMAMINNDFGLPVHGKDKVALWRDLNDFLIDQYAKGNKPTLIIDEAQNLTPKILEEIRMLSNLETNDAKLLQIIMVGQPELRETLAIPSLLQLRQRISINCHVHPLTRTELEEYILYRLQVAGNRNAVTFCDQCFDIIYRYSRGIPRLVNIICDFLLLAAFVEEKKHIDEVIVMDVIGDLDFENQFWTSRLPEDAASSEFKHLKAEQIQTKTDLVILLQGIAKRLDAMERDAAEHRKSVIEELDEKITSLCNALMVHVEETNFSVSALNREVETVKVLKECVPTLGDGNAHKEGFLRRMLK